MEVFDSDVLEGSIYIYFLLTGDYFFFFRFTLLTDDGDVAKTFENRFPEILHEGRAISTDVDFGDPRHDQLELEIKVDIASYSYI